MERYAASGRAASNGASANILSLRASSTARMLLSELHVFTEAATLSPLALSMQTAVDSGGTAIASQKEDPASGTSSCLVAVAPTTAGTKAAVPVRSCILPAVIGSAMLWTWPNGGELAIPMSLSAMLFNPTSTAGSALTWTAVWYE